MTDLEKARSIIDKTDREMARLFEERMKAAQLVAKYKGERGLQVEDRQREKLIIERNSEYILNDEFRSYYLQFMENTMAVSRAYQHRLLDGIRVAYSGVEGAFAYIASKKIFPDASAVAYPDFKSSYQAVVDGKCDCAVLPIENSYNGDVGQVMDLCFFGQLFINGIYDVSVVQNLLAVDGASINDIKQVISHPQALGQCAEYIREHNFEEIQAVNTAIAAKQVAQWGRKDIAAIASDEAAKQYGLVKLEARINESESNTTRFAVLSKTPRAASTDGHFIMMFTVKNEAGSLGKAISVIGAHGFNLRALKSRPAHELIWSYYFYVEGEGNIDSDEGKAMLAELKGCCDNIKIVGNYDKEIVL